VRPRAGEKTRLINLKIEVSAPVPGPSLRRLVIHKVHAGKRQKRAHWSTSA
jgi:hypothetical protein